MKAGVHAGIPAERYHADDLAPAPSLSSSVAKVLLSRSPLHAWTIHPRLNAACKPIERKEWDLGSAAHAALLGVGEIEVIDPIDHPGSKGGIPAGWTNNSIKAARDAARLAGRIPVLPADGAAIERMVEMAHAAFKACSDLPKGLTLDDGTAEQTLLWQEKGGIWCRARPDWMSHDRKVQISYKSTMTSAKPDDWVRTGLGIGFDLQEGFYKRGNIATGGPKEAAYLTLVQENTPPYACAWAGLDPEFMAMADEKADEAIEIWRRCMQSGRWPGYPPRVHWLMLPAWAKMKWEERGTISERAGPAEMAARAREKMFKVEDLEDGIPL